MRAVRILIEITGAGRGSKDAYLHIEHCDTPKRSNGWCYSGQSFTYYRIDGSSYCFDNGVGTALRSRGLVYPASLLG
jgi:hypothetical protein